MRSVTLTRGCWIGQRLHAERDAGRVACNGGVSIVVARVNGGRTAMKRKRRADTPAIGSGVGLGTWSVRWTGVVALSTALMLSHAGWAVAAPGGGGGHAGGDGHAGGMHGAGEQNIEQGRA
jgi:hypothetical protein